MHSHRSRCSIVLWILAFACWMIGNHSTAWVTPEPSAHQRAWSQLASGWCSWLAHAIWLSRIDAGDEPRLADMHTVLSLCPSNRFFRIQSAGIIAFSRSNSMPNPVSDANASPSKQALIMLQDGLIHDPDGAVHYHYEIAKLQLLIYRNRTAAIESFQRASQTPVPAFSPALPHRPKSAVSPHCEPEPSP